MATTIRLADTSEDLALSHVLCNAFLQIWNHNWFQNVSEPLSPVPTTPIKGESTLTPLQRARVGFYLSLIKATRLLGSEVLVNVVHQGASQTENNDTAPSYGAILLWLPPHKRMGITQFSTLYSSGFIGTMYRYGVVGIYRVNFVFEANIEKMFSAAGIHADAHAMIQMVASNVEYRGKGLASELLKWRIEKFERENPGVGVVLDTTTEQGRRTYERLGFNSLGYVEVDTGCDATGICLAKGTSKDADLKHRQWVMVRQP